MTKYPAPMSTQPLRRTSCRITSNYYHDKELRFWSIDKCFHGIDGDDFQASSFVSMIQVRMVSVESSISPTFVYTIERAIRIIIILAALQPRLHSFGGESLNGYQYQEDQRRNSSTKPQIINSILQPKEIVPLAFRETSPGKLQLGYLHLNNPKDTGRSSEYLSLFSILLLSSNINPISTPPPNTPTKPNNHITKHPNPPSPWTTPTHPSTSPTKSYPTSPPLSSSS